MEGALVYGFLAPLVKGNGFFDRGQKKRKHKTIRAV
jgi:hypothetical protein